MQIDFTAPKITPANRNLTAQQREFRAAGEAAAKALDLKAAGAAVAAEYVAKHGQNFEVGKTYTCRAIGDHNLIYRWTVIARTAKRLTLRNAHGRECVRGVSRYDGDEVCYPSGKYSMCPIIRAGRFE